MQAAPSATTSTGRRDPTELRALAAEVDALAEIPAGLRLAAALAAIDCDRLPGVHLVAVMEARQRQTNHERGELLSMVGRILVHDVPGGARMWKGPDGVAVSQVRASLRLTRSAAKRLCELTWDLHKRLPEVVTDVRRGVLDEPRARVFSEWTAGLTDDHIDAVLWELLPKAPQMTTAELIDAIAKIAIALDPEWIRRRYERALKGRRVVGKRNPDGTATLTGHDLPFDEVAAACARLDAIAHAAKSDGHPDRLDHLRADLLVGMLTGRYTAMTDKQILAALLATTPAKPDTTDRSAGADDPDEGGQDEGGEDEGPEDYSPDDDGPDDPGPEDYSPDDDGPDDPGPEDYSPDDDGPDGPGPEDYGPDDDGQDDDGPDKGGEGGNGGGGSGHEDPDRHGTDGIGGIDGNHGNPDHDPDHDPYHDGSSLTGTLGRRAGLRLWMGLLTVMGGDQRPGELLGWGPVHAELACDIALSLPSWWCVLTGENGAPHAVVPIRRRPPPATPATASADPVVRPRRAGECWLSVDADMLKFLTTMDEIGLLEPGWSRVLAEIKTSLAAAPTGPPNGDPTARLPGAALRRWIHIRDRRCQFPGCRAPAHRTDADHTIEHARGGPTVDFDLAAACGPDHMLRHEGGWTVAQPEPGRVVWTSPLGLRYERLPTLDLGEVPEPRQGAVREEHVDPDDLEELYGEQVPLPWWDPPSCLKPGPEPDFNEAPPSRPPRLTLRQYAGLAPIPGQTTPDEEMPF